MLILASAFATLPKHLFVDPEETGSLHLAAAKVRAILSENPEQNIFVNLLPGLHHVDNGLVLGPEDGGRGSGVVTWRSADMSNPAVIGAPIRVTGWKQHPRNPKAFSAPLPSNVIKGTYLRQLWVNGMRAERPRIYGHGRQQGDNRNGFCLNLTNVTATKMYPEGSEYDFSFENATDPSQWPNPTDVEFVFHSCDAINCWIEPRCTVEAVKEGGKAVSLKQGDNSSCYHRLYYYAQCFNNGKGPGRHGNRGRNPTHLENVGTNFTQPGQFYYDRADGSIGYIPRAGETMASVEATATTATVQELLVVNHTQNVRWEGVTFQHATWLGASGSRGFVDTQSAYLCQDGEPPVNVRVGRSPVYPVRVTLESNRDSYPGAKGVTFTSCAFQHLGGVYALGADAGSQDVIVFNSTFTDISGGGIKLGSSGERGAPAPNVTLDPVLQDRGFLVSDNSMHGLPREYSGANPIFAGYVADTHLVHNTIADSTYSSICAGWGWGESSYMRGVRIENNSLHRMMQTMADGGGVYTNTPCPDCHVSRNYMEGDPAVYGCLYHDGGSSLWTDEDNVFNNISSSSVFCHGSCPGITISPIYYNASNSGAPNLQGATNNKLHDKDGVCVSATVVKLGAGEQWTGVAADVVAKAGRRQASMLPPLASLRLPPLSPPVNETADRMRNLPCIKFGARPCDASKASQRWHVASTSGEVTNVRSAVVNGTCWQVNNCGYGGSITCDVASNNDYVPVKYPDGCKPLPNTSQAGGNIADTTIFGPAVDTCSHNQAFKFNANGTISVAWTKTDKGAYSHRCLQIANGGSVGVVDCYPEPDPSKPPPASRPGQIWKVKKNGDGTISIHQTGKKGDLCVDNNYRP